MLQERRLNSKGEQYVVGPTGTPLTLNDLPPSNTDRWVIRRKAEVVAALRGHRQMGHAGPAHDADPELPLLRVSPKTLRAASGDGCGPFRLRASKSRRFRTKWPR
jgi:hypothetical protein